MNFQEILEFNSHHLVRISGQNSPHRFHGRSTCPFNCWCIRGLQQHTPKVTCVKGCI